MLFYHQPDINQLLQASIIQVCQDKFHGCKIEVDGIICISSTDESSNVVVKVHEVINNINGDVDSDVGSDVTPHPNSSPSPKLQEKDLAQKDGVLIVEEDTNNDIGDENKLVMDKKQGNQYLFGSLYQNNSKSVNLGGSSNHLNHSPTSTDTSRSSQPSPHSTSGGPRGTNKSGTNGNINSMLMHLKPNEELVCRKCNYMCHGYINLEQHNFNCHQLYTCHKCLTTFTMHNSLVGHLRNDHCRMGSEENISESEEVNSSVVMESYDDEEKSSQPMDLECRECGCFSGDAESLSRHNQNQHNKFTCMECFATFSFQTNLYRHKKLHISGSQLYRCLVCNKGYKRREQLQNHMFRHQVKGLFSCSLCPQSFSNQVSLVNHMKGKHGIKKMWMCLKCNMGFHSSLNYTHHAKSHIRDTAQWNYESDFPSHQNTNKMNGSDGFGSKQDVVLSSKLFPAMFYRCTHCSIPPFRNLKSYTDHMRMHENQSKEPLTVKTEYNEEDCNGPVDYSMKAIHKDEERSTNGTSVLYTSDGLSPNAFIESKLRENYHPKTSYLQTKENAVQNTHPSNCAPKNAQPVFPGAAVLTPVSSVSQGDSAMMYTFSLGDKSPRGRPPKMIKMENVQLPKDALADLKDQSLFKNQTQFKCKWCDCDTMNDFEVYTNHVAENHGRFVCPVCGDGFTVKSNLRRHLRNIHMVNNPNFKVCNLCGVEFNRSDSYKIHREKIHGIPIPNKKPKAPTVKQMIISSKEGSFPPSPYGQISPPNSEQMDYEDSSSPLQMSQMEALYPSSPAMKNDKDATAEAEPTEGSSLVGVTGQWSSVVGTGEWISPKTPDDLQTEEEMTSNTEENGTDPHFDYNDDSVIDTSSEYLQEAQDVHQVIPCSSCSVKYTAFNEYELHAESSHSIYPCRFCLKPFSLKVIRNRHILQHRRSYPYLCNDCGRRYAKVDSLEAHIKDSHKI